MEIAWDSGGRREWGREVVVLLDAFVDFLCAGAFPSRLISSGASFSIGIKIWMTISPATRECKYNNRWGEKKHTFTKISLFLTLCIDCSLQWGQVAHFTVIQLLFIRVDCLREHVQVGASCRYGNCFEPRMFPSTSILKKLARRERKRFRETDQTTFPVPMEGLCWSLIAFKRGLLLSARWRAINNFS